MVHEGHVSLHELEHSNEKLSIENGRLEEKMTDMVRTGVVKEEVVMVTDKVLEERDPLTGEIIKLLERKNL